MILCICRWSYLNYDILTSAPSECCWTGDDWLRFLGVDLSSVHCVGCCLGDEVEAGRVDTVPEACRLGAVLKKDVLYVSLCLSLVIFRCDDCTCISVCLSVCLLPILFLPQRHGLGDFRTPCSWPPSWSDWGQRWSATSYRQLKTMKKILV